MMRIPTDNRFPKGCLQLSGRRRAAIIGDRGRVQLYRIEHPTLFNEPTAGEHRSARFGCQDP